MAESNCPPFGVGSVDFAALHKAAKDGGDMTKAVENATKRVKAPKTPEPQKEPEAKAPTKEPEKPAGKDAK